MAPRDVLEQPRSEPRDARRRNNYLGAKQQRGKKNKSCAGKVLHKSKRAKDQRVNEKENKTVEVRYSKEDARLSRAAS